MPAHFNLAASIRMISKNKIKQISALSRKKNRDLEGLFIAEGAKTISEFFRNGYKAEYLVCLESSPYTATVTHTEMITSTPEEMKKISLFAHPAQEIAVFQKPVKPKYLHHPGINDLVVALDGIQDPGNLGTIIRLCSWFGISNLLCSSDTADCFGPKAVQASMGALAQVNVHYLDLVEALGKSKQKGIPVFGTFLEGENIYRSSLPKNGIIILGNEGHGIRPELAKIVSEKIHIPSFPPGQPAVESLNVSMAASILISEFRRVYY